MNELDLKIIKHLLGLVVRKDLVKTINGNATVPSYVLEYLLGQYCSTFDEPAIQSGIETVKEILRKHYVHRKKANQMLSNIKEEGCYKVIDKISVSLNAKDGVYEAKFSNLGINKVLVTSGTVKEHSKLLLLNGAWCIADIKYSINEDKKACPWILSFIQPIQSSSFDFGSYLEARKKFTTAEWIDLLIQSIGLKPAIFDNRSKLLQLVRLIPYCERNYNLIELGPKATGKSHLYSEFSPNGMLISGGEVSTPKLFVNNANGKIGLVGYCDVVTFDEFTGKKKQVDKFLVDIMKNYMANKSFSRGEESLWEEASMVFIGNTQQTLSSMLQHSNLFVDLPANFRDSAFLDRLHFYLPGWEMNILHGKMYSDGYGFVMDFLAEALHSMRGRDYSDRYKAHFSLSSDIPVRDQEGINKTFSGLMKIIFPHEDASKEEIEELLHLSIEGRKRVKDHLMRIDASFPKVTFTYQDTTTSAKAKLVSTLEEEEFFHDYLKIIADGGGIHEELPTSTQPLNERHITIQNDQRDISFDKMFGAYLRGANKITVTEPYVHRLHQIQNLIEFLDTVLWHKPKEKKVAVHLITTEEKLKGELQRTHLEKIKISFGTVGIDFTWEFDNTGTIHARHIETDHGWKILLGRGLDIFRQCGKNDTFTFASRLQQFRRCEMFDVAYLKNENSSQLQKWFNHN